MINLSFSSVFTTAKNASVLYTFAEAAAIKNQKSQSCFWGLSVWPFIFLTKELRGSSWGPWSLHSEWVTAPPPQLFVLVLSPASGPGATQPGSHSGLLLKGCSFLGGVWVLRMHRVLLCSLLSCAHPGHHGAYLWSQDSEGEGREDQKFKTSLRHTTCRPAQAEWNQSLSLF